MAKAFIVAAPNSASGKTLITLGLIRALKNRGMKVASAKFGPDYIDPQFHHAASGQPCVNLDLWAMGADLCRHLLNQVSIDNDLVVIEGVMGLFDGPQYGKGSTADLAEALGLPIILVVDSSHQSQSVAAVIHGFSTFRPSLEIAGVILNRIRSDRHQSMLVQSVDTNNTVLGLMRQNDSLNMPSRHLGLIQPQEIQTLEMFIESAAAAVARETLLDKIKTIGSKITNQAKPELLPPLGQHVSVARDEAFSFIYAHILKGWRNQGAELSFFSPLNDEVPDQNADAVFLPGGYPELHAAKLSSCTTFFAGLKNSSALIYGECGGFMVLGQILRDAQGLDHQMAGLLPVKTSFRTRKLHLGYRELRPLAGPWKKTLRAHEFHYSTLINQGTADPLFEVSATETTPSTYVGARIGNVMGSYLHIIAEKPA